VEVFNQKRQKTLIRKFTDNHRCDKSKVIVSGVWHSIIIIIICIVSTALMTKLQWFQSAGIFTAVIVTT